MAEQNLVAGVQVRGNHNRTITEERYRVTHVVGGQPTLTEERVVTRDYPTRDPPAPAGMAPRPTIRYMISWVGYPPQELVYDERSTLTFREQRVEGLQGMARVLGFYEQRCSNATVGAFQPIRDTGGTIVVVDGNVQIPGEHQPRAFHQVFNLMPTAEGSYYVQNDIFRTIPA